jgi:hypothetical protein
MTLAASNMETYSTFCSNPNCDEPFDLDKAKAEIIESGVVYADCRDAIFQGYKCPDNNCPGIRFIKCARNNPVFDLRGFIIAPNSEHFPNVAEQIYLAEQSDNHHEFLKFKIIPAWDDETVSIRDLQQSFPEGMLDIAISSGTPYFMNQIEFQERRQSEIETGTIQLRRLYPDTPRFRNLLTILAPNRITEMVDVGAFRAEGDSAKEFQEKNNAWRALLEEGGGKGLNEAVIELLRDKGVADLDENQVETLIVRELSNYHRKGAQLLQEQATQVGFEKTIWKSFESAFNDILHSVCTELALVPTRQELIGWVNKAEKGKALFVDAPMGLGKTYSIVEALADNLELSAVIFMPTKKLCEEIIRRLKGRIAANKGIDYWEIYQNLNNRKFLESDVYYADGINPEECPHYWEIIQRYRQNWIRRRDLCVKCQIERGCRFNSHWIEAPLSRIVVATHYKYNNFYRQSGIRKWYKDGYFKRDENGDIINSEDDQPIKLDSVERNFFIVDEDIVLSQCYTPVSLKYRELHDFLATVRTFVDQFSGTEEINEKIFSLAGKVELCEKTSFIRPIDPDFRFTKTIRKEWDKSNNKLLKALSNIDEPPQIVGNHLDLIEDAIRFGFVVQKYPGHHRIYFHNRKAYDLKKLPPHVFFDGTMINKRFLKKRLQGVKLERMKIRVKPLWDLKVSQNINTDLPIAGISSEQESVKNFLRFLFHQLDSPHKFLILSSKTTWQRYLNEFLRVNFSHIDYVPGYFGNLRGINDAKDCDVGIMLGSYLPSDAVEITMALEFIQNILPKKAATITKNYFWTDKGSKGKRVYKRKYNIINEISKTLRYAEQRQAIARTRYLFHDVDFYVISKDPVREFEAYAQLVEDNFGEAFFKPRKERSDSKFQEIKEKILNLIMQEGELTEMNLHCLTGHSRTTLRKHLKRMMDEKAPIVREGKKYTFPKGV